MKLDDRIWELGIKKSLWKSNDLILVACSGGVDSMALLEVFRLWRERGKIRLCAIHCNHQLRGEESERDEQGVRDWCTKQEIPLMVQTLPVLETQKMEKGNLEEVARILRYAAIREAYSRFSASAVALAHHRDDQAETALLHLFRGSGAVKGMKMKSGPFIRPFLYSSKNEIVQFAKNQNLPYWEDSTNENIHFRRNWIRRELLPLLRSNVNSEIELALARWVDISIEDEAFWESYIGHLFGEIVTINAKQAKISIPAFNLLALAEKRRILRKTLFLLQMQNLRGIEFQHVESLIDIAGKNIGKSQVSLPNHWRGRIFQGNLYIEQTTEERNYS